MFIPRDPPPRDEWEYFKFSKHIAFSMKPGEDLENVFEPVVIVRVLKILVFDTSQ
jgi:hypothetical protein